jgi:hypothetical protein
MDRECVELAPSRQQILELMERPDRIQFDWLQREFPEELLAICALLPLQASPSRDQFLMQLTAIVYLFRGRFENVEGAKQSVHDLENGIANLKLARQGFGQIISFGLEAALPEASKKCPRLKGLNSKEVLELFDESCVMLDALSEAMRAAAGISALPRRQGDKGAYYFVPAFFLAELWESVTAKRVPTPKYFRSGDLHGKQPPFVSKQPSTRFIRLALRMIDPAITDAQVFTAIKNTREVPRDELYSS